MEIERTAQTFIVTFEINNLERRKALKGKIKALFKTYCPIHKNAWAIRSELKASEIRDAFKKGLTSKDRLFIIRSGTQAAWTNAYGSTNSEWLKTHL